MRPPEAFRDHRFAIIARADDEHVGWPEDRRLSQKALQPGDCGLRRGYPIQF